MFGNQLMCASYYEQSWCVMSSDRYNMRASASYLLHRELADELMIQANIGS
jgi:hypothetical protein